MDFDHHVAHPIRRKNRSLTEVRSVTEEPALTEEPVASDRANTEAQVDKASHVNRASDVNRKSHVNRASQVNTASHVNGNPDPSGISHTQSFLPRFQLFFERLSTCSARALVTFNHVVRAKTRVNVIGHTHPFSRVACDPRDRRYG